MARQFASVSLQYLEYAGAVTNALPVTFACFFYADSAHTGVMMSISDTGSLTRRLNVECRNTSILRLTFNDGTTNGTVDASATYSTGVWSHAAGVFAGTADRTIYLNGGNSVNNTTAASASIASLNTTNAGCRNLSTGRSTFFNGRIAEFGMWSAALSAAEIAALAKGASPLRIRPGSLLAYWPLYGDGSPEPNYGPSGGTYNLTVSGATQAAHAPAQSMFGFDLGWQGTAGGGTPPAPAPQGWYVDEHFRPGRPARALARDEQCSGTIYSLPPFSTFKEGWQAQPKTVFPAARAVARDEQSSQTVLSLPPFSTLKEGWNAEPAFVPRLSRAVARDEQSSMTILAAPPFSVFAEGWQAEPGFIPRLSRALAHDEQSSQGILSVPPFSVFREGWEANRVVVTNRFRPPQETPLYFEFVATPLSFPEGWQGDVRWRRPPAPSAALARDEQAVQTILAAPPLAVFREGWQAERSFVRQPPVPPRHDEGPLPAFRAPTPQGWEALPAATIRPVPGTVVRDPQAAVTVLATPPLAPPFPEGWQSTTTPGYPFAPARSLRLETVFVYPSPAVLAPGEPVIDVVEYAMRLIDQVDYALYQVDT